METEAIVGILKRCAKKEWELVGSDIIELELSKNPDIHKSKKALQLHEGSSVKIKYNMDIKNRAEHFREFGAKNFDSIHLAMAEYAGVYVFLTTDIRLLNSAKRMDTKMRVLNPLNFYMEVLSHEFGGRF
jgi:predicted nucleic acid-binding protein